MFKDLLGKIPWETDPEAKEARASLSSSRTPALKLKSGPF